MNYKRFHRDSQLKGLLLDLDGVMYVDSEAIDGAQESLQTLRSLGLQCRFITNTTTQTPLEIKSRLEGLGFDVGEYEVFSVLSACKDYLLAQGGKARLVMRDTVKTYFADIPQTLDQPDFVVVGDVGEAWEYSLLNDIAMQLLDGAELMALHKNRTWQTQDALKLDIGLFVAGLEYVSEKEAIVIGKPSYPFFNQAILSMDLHHKNVLMIGDDMYSDIAGAQQHGIYAVQVQTGKFRKKQYEQSGISADALIPSIADLPLLVASIVE